MEFSIANADNEYARTVPCLVLSVVNVLLVFGFILRFKKKIDFVTKSTKLDTDDKDEKELYLAVHTMMVQNLNRTNKYNKTVEQLNDVFRTIYDEKLIVKVTIIPELRSLDY